MPDKSLSRMKKKSCRIRNLAATEKALAAIGLILMGWSLKCEIDSATTCTSVKGVIVSRSLTFAGEGEFTQSAMRNAYNSLPDVT